jgi:hypothetical protein
MSVLNAILARVTDAVLAPLSALSPLVGLTVVSLVTAVVMLIVFKRASNQTRLAAVKRSIHAALFEIRLFNDDFRAIVRAQGEILRHNAVYLWLSVLPMIWVIVPLMLVIAQLQFHYGYAAVAPGEDVLLKVQLRRGSGDDVSLDAHPAVRPATPAVWLPASSEVVWRLRAAQPGRYDLRIRVGAETHAKSMHVAGGVVRRSPLRPNGSLLDQLLYPSEPPLPGDAAVSAISLGYRERDIDVLGWDMNWMVVYFGLSLLFAVALKKPLGVTI